MSWRKKDRRFGAVSVTRRCEASYRSEDWRVCLYLRRHLRVGEIAGDALLPAFHKGRFVRSRFYELRSRDLSLFLSCPHPFATLSDNLRTGTESVGIRLSN